MANISAQDNRYFTLDKISADSYGLIISRNGTGIDCSNATSVTGFTLGANIPSGTSVRFAFADGDSWFRLDTSGASVNIMTGTPDYNAVISSGNTSAELSALTSVPAFVGKTIRVAVAVSSTKPDSAVPQVKLSVKAVSSDVQTSFTEYSPVFELGAKSQLSEIAFRKIITGNATVSLQGKAIRADGTESEWLDTELLRGAQASGLQLRAVYSTPAPNAGSAKISLAEASYYTGTNATSGGQGRIYSITQDWYKPITHARLSIKHSPLSQSSMKIYAAFRASPVLVLREQLGVAPPNRKTYQLAHINGIRYDSFRLYADSQEIFSGYELNCASGRVSFTAPEGSIIIATYEYGWDKEQWREMTLKSRMSLPDYDESQYTLDAPDNKSSAACFLIVITASSGHVNNESLGSATGHLQTAQLKHRATNITSMQYNNGSWVNLPAANYSLMDDSRLIRFAAAKGKSVRISYDYESEPVRLFSAAAVFSD